MRSRTAPRASAGASLQSLPSTSANGVAFVDVRAPPVLNVVTQRYSRFPRRNRRLLRNLFAIFVLPCLVDLRDQCALAELVSARGCDRAKLYSQSGRRSWIQLRFQCDAQTSHETKLRPLAAFERDARDAPALDGKLVRPIGRALIFDPARIRPRLSHVFVLSVNSLELLRAQGSATRHLYTPYSATGVLVSTV